MLFRLFLKHSVDAKPNKLLDVVGKSERNPSDLADS
jgi:hypothetical protein